MIIDHDRDIYLLAFDHRASFETDLFSLAGPPTERDIKAIADAKAVIFEGFQRAFQSGLSPERAGILVDEEYGADLARRAKSEGVLLAMPVEKSGQPEFELQYGETFAAHIEEFIPDFVKVLVRYNPDGDRVVNARQAERLNQLSIWLREHGRKFLFELLVPPTTAQLDGVANDHDRYDDEIRPDLEERTIRELQEAGVEPDIWKIEGMNDGEAYERVLKTARRNGRDNVRCIVLGRGANEVAVDRWLRVGAAAGFSGFAIGRTIWWAPLQDMLAGKLDRDRTADRIANAYRRAVNVYCEALNH